MNFILAVFLCSSIQGNACKQIQPDIKEFKDHYDCAIHGYQFAQETISGFDRKFVNDYKVYMKFMCNKKQKDQV
jgi:hypothetical protein|tara:strand:- start:4 stop:225 length:222 start_codon:yes stop_codon:yes gene_type:complete